MAARAYVSKRHVSTKADMAVVRDSC